MSEPENRSLTELQAEIVLAIADNNLKISGAADAIFRHRNTMEYHINKIREITGKNPLNFWDMSWLVIEAKRVLGSDAIRGDQDGVKTLNTIQKRGNLNAVHRADGAGAGNASHYYLVSRVDDYDAYIQAIQFQHGPRKDDSSVQGVLDCDLLEIVRDRLTAFQSGDMRCRENACALTHIEEALMWMARRADDRIDRNVLGTMER